MKIFDLMERTENKNQELLEFFLNDKNYNAIVWPILVRWLVFKTEGDGVLEIEQITGGDFSREEFDEEYDLIISLDPETIIPKLSPDIIEEFKSTNKDSINELLNSSNTKNSFHLISDTVLPKSSILIHYTDHPEEVFKKGFKRGIPYISMLGETVRYNLSNTVGYNFSYLEKDDNHNFQKGSFKKRGFVKFKSSGVYVYHYGDKDKQVIFWGGYIEPSDFLDYGYI